MKIKQYILTYYAFLFIGFGAAGFIAPDVMANLLNYDITHNIAKMEFMAVYGGLLIGIGGFKAYCLKDNVDLGLICTLLTMATMLVGRVAGLVSYGETDLVQNIYFAGEAFTVVLILFLLFKTEKHEQAFQS